MITSAGNERLKTLRKLMSKAGERKKNGLYTAEGPKLFLEAPLASIECVYISESFEKKNTEMDTDGPVSGKLRQVKWESIKDDLFTKLADTKTPQGIITVLKVSYASKEDILKADPAFLIALESIQDPGNLGTIIRSAEAAGSCGIIINEGCADPFGPKAVRASAGSVFRMPVFSAESLPDLVAELKKSGIRVYATHLKGLDYHTTQDYTKPSLFLIGNEGRGLSESLASLADEYVKIPMEGSVESLNASLAATIIMYEVHRQRHNKN